MTSTFTSNLNLQLQATGDNPNTWGTTLNTNVFTIIDKNLGGRNNISVAGSSDVTLTQSQNDNIYQKMTGILTGSINYILKSQGRFMLLNNASTGAFNITAKPVGGSGIVIPQSCVVPVFVNPDTSALTAAFDTLPSLNLCGSSAPAAGAYLQATNTLGLSSRSLPIALFVNPASAVNYFTFTGGATGSPLTFQASGGDSNIGMNYLTKGTSAHAFYTNAAQIQLQVVHTASAVDYLTITGSASGLPLIQAAGASTDASILLAAKGAGGIAFITNTSLTQVQVNHTASAVNYLALSGNVTGGPPTINAQGTDTNIDLFLGAKGTGVIRFGSYTASIISNTGYITIKDGAGNTRRLMVG